MANHLQAVVDSPGLASLCSSVLNELVKRAHGDRIEWQVPDVRIQHLELLRIRPKRALASFVQIPGRCFPKGAPWPHTVDFGLPNLFHPVIQVSFRLIDVTRSTALSNSAAPPSFFDVPHAFTLDEP